MKGEGMDLNKTQRSALLDKIEATVAEKYYDPAFSKTAWQAIVGKHRQAILSASTTEAFEKEITAMLTELSPKTLGLLSGRTPINPRNAINASFSVQEVFDGLRWVFQDVLPGGVSAQAGAKTGDRVRTLTDSASSLKSAERSTVLPLFRLLRRVGWVVIAALVAHSQVLSQSTYRV